MGFPKPIVGQFGHADYPLVGDELAGEVRWQVLDQPAEQAAHPTGHSKIPDACFTNAL